MLQSGRATKLLRTTPQKKPTVFFFETVPHQHPLRLISQEIHRWDLDPKVLRWNSIIHQEYFLHLYENSTDTVCENTCKYQSRLAGFSPLPRKPQAFLEKTCRSQTSSFSGTMSWAASLRFLFAPKAWKLSSKYTPFLTGFLHLWWKGCPGNNQRIFWEDPSPPKKKSGPEGRQEFGDFAVLFSVRFTTQMLGFPSRITPRNSEKKQSFTKKCIRNMLWTHVSDLKCVLQYSHAQKTRARRSPLVRR